MCLAQGPQRSDTGEARTENPKIGFVLLRTIVSAHYFCPYYIDEQQKLRWVWAACIHKVWMKMTVQTKIQISSFTGYISMGI